MPSSPESDPGRPAVSVVIPTHNRETRLRFALEALASQTMAADDFEVIVVRSAGAEPPLAEAPEGLRARFLTFPGRSTRPAKRNFGWRAASGELIAFTDDDCRPSPGWLASLLAASEGDPRALVQGRTEPDPDERHLLHGPARSVEVVGPTPWYETCNLAVARDLLEALDGFDEAYVATGEDTDLGLRAEALGAERRYADAALVWHAVMPQPLPDAVRQGWRRWESTPLVYKRHPAHRRHLYGRVFFNRTHAALAALAVGSLLFGRRRPALTAASAIPFVLDGIHFRYLSPRGIVRQTLHFPARLLVEAAETAGMVRGAIRHRTMLI